VNSGTGRAGLGVRLAGLLFRPRRCAERFDRSADGGDRLDPRRKKLRAPSGLIPPLALFLGLSSPGCRPESPAARLAREIAGAYPAEAAPTGVVRTFDIEAREAELPLVDGGKLRVWAYNGQ